MEEIEKEKEEIGKESGEEKKKEMGIGNEAESEGREKRKMDEEDN